MDTLLAGNEGEFQTNIIVNDPAFYSINFNNRQKMTFILAGNEEEVRITADGNDPRGTFEISGSASTDYKQRMDDVIREFQSQRTAINGKIRQSRIDNNIEAYNRLVDESTKMVMKTEQKLKDLIWESIPSLAAYYGTQMIQLDNNFTFIDSVANELLSAHPDNFFAKDLAKKVNLSRDLAIGAKAPEISLPNPDGEIIKLSSLRGNYVLIDFWAAWCRPCRAENPNVLRMYNQYADKNFEILGVSLDRTRDAWLKAIEQDGLPWVHISDLKYFQSEAAVTYNINAIPATYLIDPEGNIIAKNLRGPSLEAKLKEIFG
jgi:peroxiredoxin